jgi:hypothetical protein
MIEPEAVREILDIYNKHGWTLRRVLLSANGREALAADADRLFGAVPVLESSLNALWFSRPSRKGLDAWELRRLTGTPFALLQALSPLAGDEEMEAVLGAVEEKMLAAAARFVPPQNGY